MSVVHNSKLSGKEEISGIIMSVKKRSAPKISEEPGQEHHKKLQRNQSAFQPLQTWDTVPHSNLGTPYHPRIEEHSAMLSRISSPAQRHSLIMQIHRTYGNSYIQLLLESAGAQAKLAVSTPNDIYEQEADRMAEEIIGLLSSQPQHHPEEDIKTKPDMSFQRQPEEEEEELQTMVQRQNLADSPDYAWRGPDAPEWYEYDRLLKIARDRYPDMTLEISEQDEFGQPARWHITLFPGMDSEELTRHNVLHWMARFTGQTVRPPPDYTQPTSPDFKPGWRSRQTTAPAGAPVMEKTMNQGSGREPVASNDIENRINSERGGGHPLPDVLRGPMEQAFGADFSGVRVHTGSQADILNQQLSARAFTTGQDIFFRDGEYSPGSEGTRKLIAHELTHVVQQNKADILYGKQNEEEPDHKTLTRGKETKILPRNTAERSAIEGGLIQRVTGDGKLEEGDIERRTSGQKVKFTGLIGGCIAITVFDGSGALGMHLDLDLDHSSDWARFFGGISGSAKKVMINSDMIGQRQGWRVPLRNNKPDLNMSPMGTAVLYFGLNRVGDDVSKNWMANDLIDNALVWSAEKIHIMDWFHSRLGVWPLHSEQTTDISYNVP